MKPVHFLFAVLLSTLVGPLHAAPPPPAASLSGEVLEARNVDGYTYLRLKTASGEAWAAVPTATVAKGAQVTIARPMMMENFESKTLKKTFDKIAFGMIETPGSKAASPHGAMPAGNPGVGAPKVVKVAKADGPDAKSVAEVVGGKAALKDKTVSVRGQVVKYNPGIMGKNWLHLRDGSGSAADGSNDIIVTTQDKAAVGDVVTARGTVRKDVDLGAGYIYAVIIDGAALRK